MYDFIIFYILLNLFKQKKYDRLHIIIIIIIIIMLSLFYLMPLIISLCHVTLVF